MTFGGNVMGTRASVQMRQTNGQGLDSFTSTVIRVISPLKAGNQMEIDWSMKAIGVVLY